MKKFVIATMIAAGVAMCDTVWLHGNVVEEIPAPAVETAVNAKKATVVEIETEEKSAKARHIDFITGLQFFGRLGRSWLWYRIFSGHLLYGRLEFRICGRFNRLCLWFRTFLLGCFLLRNLVFHLCQ